MNYTVAKQIHKILAFITVFKLEILIVRPSKIKSGSETMITIYKMGEGGMVLVLNCWCLLFY